MIGEARELTELERSVVETVVYSDLFDYPLTITEIHRYLVGRSAAPGEVEAAVESLIGRFLSRHGDHVFVVGRDHLLPQRWRREQACKPQWAVARRYSHGLGRMPFVRMVAICGSLAVDNADDRGDIDVFCIAAPGRVWWVHVAAMLLRRRPSFAAKGVCPNVFLSLGDLRLRHQNLYAAREVVQAVPVTGSAAYARFVAANSWLQDYLPNAVAAASKAPVAPEARGTLVATVERVFSGRLGAAVDWFIYVVLFRYFALRLRSRGVTAQQLRNYYQRDRQLVVGGGYTDIVRTRFADRLGEVLGQAVASEAASRLFPPHERPGELGADPALAPSVYRRKFRGRYGVER